MISIAEVLADEAHRAAPVATARRDHGGGGGQAHASPRGFNGFDPAAFAPGGGGEAIDASLAVMAAHNRRSAKSHSGIWRDLAVRKRKTEVDATAGSGPGGRDGAGDRDARHRPADRDDP